MTSLTDARWELSGKGGGVIPGRFFNSFQLASKTPSRKPSQETKDTRIFSVPLLFKCELLVSGGAPVRDISAISGTSWSVRDYSIHPQLPHTHTIATLSISTHQVKTKIWGRGDKLNFGHQQFWLPCYESTCVFPIWRWGISSWRHPFCWFSGKRPFWRNVNSYSADLLWWWTSVRSPMMKWWWILEGRDKFWGLPATCNNL